ncbi:MAG: polyprenyl synthetase family protein [Thermodesulfobacteriota bacterium]
MKPHFPMMQMSDLQAYLAHRQSMVNQWIEAYFSQESLAEEIAAAMQYAVSAGGKRVRPILFLASSESVGGNPSDLLPIACALELIHTYSLIHDDLPAMDDDALRRGKPTLHIEFDEATAILAGDALLTLAFQILSDPQFVTSENGQATLKVMHRVSVAAGYGGMIGGQMLDMMSEGKKLNLNEIKVLHKKKTGALIEASVFSGALMGGADANEMQALNAYASHIGLAFQVADDILNVIGDPAKMGKAVGTDIDRDKNTFPSIMGIAESQTYARLLVEKALHAIESFDKKAEPLRAIAHYIIERSN